MDVRFWIRIDGAKTGPMNKETHAAVVAEPPPGGVSPTPGHIAGLDFAYEGEAGTAPAGAVARRVHQPIRITKRWSPSTPQLFGAFTTNELLKSVRLDFIGKVDNTIHQTIELTSARVVRVRWYIADGVELEEIDLTFEKMVVRNLVADTSAEVSWKLLGG